MGRVFDGVYVTHTGALSPAPQEWAAVLLHWPAALAGASARVPRQSVDGGRAGVEIVVAAQSASCRPAGSSHPADREVHDVALMNLSPPRVRLEHAVVTVASEARSDDAAVAVLADACQRRRTTAWRLVDALHGRPRLARRGLLLEILEDVASGAYSALERRYLAGVERPHGLPTARRQRRVRPGRSVAYRDVEYRGLATVVELDGRLGHDVPGIDGRTCNAISTPRSPMTSPFASGGGRRSSPVGSPIRFEAADIPRVAGRAPAMRHPLRYPTC